MVLFQQPFMSGGFPSMNRAVAGAVGGWVELARTTLGSANGTITVSGLSDKRYYMVLSNLIDTGGALRLRTGNGSTDTGNNYAARWSLNGGTDSTFTSRSDIPIGDNMGAVTEGRFSVGYGANLSGNEKLFINHLCDQETAGAGTAPTRVESVGKWTNTSNPLDRFVNYTATSETFGTGSEVVVLGWDPADTHTNNFWEELASVELGSSGDNLSSGTFTAKKYLWIQYMLLDTGGTINDRMTFNNVSTGTPYAYRVSSNGGSDSTLTSQNEIQLHNTLRADPHFVNMFIVNDGSNEKLGIAHFVQGNTAGAGNAPDRREVVFKDSSATQITEIDIDNTGSGSYNTGSILKVWGAD